MTDVPTCKYCKNTFKTKTILKTHQTKAKYCLKLQGIKPKATYQCTLCPKSFTVKSSYNRHCALHLDDPVAQQLEETNVRNRDLKMEVENLREIICDLKNTNIRLENKLTKALMKAISTSKTTNNTIINNFAPITPERMREILPGLTKTYLMENPTPRGYANLFLKRGFRNNIHCSDYSRRILKYKNKDGILYTDPRGVKLLPELAKIIEPHNSDTISRILKEEGLDVSNEEDMELVLKLTACSIGIKYIRDEEENDFTIDLLRELCSLSS